MGELVKGNSFDGLSVAGQKTNIVIAIRDKEEKAEDKEKENKGTVVAKDILYKKKGKNVKKG